MDDISELKTNNRIIIDFYKKNKHLDFDKLNLIFIESYNKKIKDDINNIQINRNHEPLNYII